jgi:hypothetical protein
MLTPLLASRVGDWRLFIPRQGIGGVIRFGIDGSDTVRMKDLLQACQWFTTVQD